MTRRWGVGLPLTKRATQLWGSGYYYLAASVTGDATGSWEKWSDDACITNRSFGAPDQPLLGWSSQFVVIDVVCGTPPANGPFGPDNVFVIPNSTITSGTPTLPLAISAPCQKMTPTRDRQGSLSDEYSAAG